MISQVLTRLPLLSLVLAAPLQQRWYPSGSCVTDVKFEPCSDYDCHLEGYHRIDAFLNQAENTTQWNYVMYKIEDQISASCVTDLVLVEEGGSAPSGDDWYPSPHSSLSGVTPGGGAQLYSRRAWQDQLAGNVIDLITVKPGLYSNRSEEFIRLPVMLGLGEAAGSAAYADWHEYNSVSSGYLWLEYTKAGARAPITDVQVVSCPAGSFGPDCGKDLIAQGWTRLDANLNGPLENTTQVHLFTSTKATDGKCVTHLKLAHLPVQETLPLNINAGLSAPPVYLQVRRGQNSSHAQCITSIVPIDSSLALPKVGYEVVTDEALQLGNFNDVKGSYPVWLYYSTDSHVAPKAQAPQLNFNSTGGMRIAHFSDLHLPDANRTCQDLVDPAFQANCTEEWNFRFMENALDLVKPDLVILNGDLYAEWNITMYTTGALQKAIFPIVQRGLPFAVTWGNHDAEGQLLREELQREMDRQPGFVGGRGRPDLDGIGNYKVDVYKPDGSTGSRLWFFDSRSYTYFPNNGSQNAYGYVKDTQVQWYESEADTAINAMAFFHIPLDQYSPQLNLTDTPIIGVHGEAVCAQGNGCTNEPDLNNPYTPLFDSFVRTGDVKATTSGHDHDNDYALVLNGITLMYDGSGGYTAYGNPIKTYNREMRVIDIMEYGNTAQSFKVIDDIFQGTVHVNGSEPVLTLW